MQMAKIFSCKISAHRYYTETPHEFNILTSFLNRIWVQLSESFSELKIGWFLCHLDQKIILILKILTRRELVGNLTLTLQVYLMLPMVAFNWLSQQLFYLLVILQIFILDHFHLVHPKLIILVINSWYHPPELFYHFRGLETDKTVGRCW